MPPGDRMLMATGPTPMRDGHGYHTRISGGPPTIMDVGSGWPITAGSGDPVMNGAQPGSPGVSVAVTLVGRHCPRKQKQFTKAGHSLAISTSSSISVRG